jgi:hypothetical protein
MAVVEDKLQTVRTLCERRATPENAPAPSIPGAPAVTADAGVPHGSRQPLTGDDAGMSRWRRTRLCSSRLGVFGGRDCTPIGSEAAVAACRGVAVRLAALRPAAVRTAGGQLATFCVGFSPARLQPCYFASTSKSSTRAALKLLRWSRFQAE